MKPPRSAALRRGRHSEIGRVYLLTTVTEKRTPVFTDFALARLAVNALCECDRSGASGTLAFVLMPDHLHWLVALRTGTLPELARRFKSNSARAVNRARNAEGRLWQSGFHDHAVRRDENLAALARYVVANPLRTGLAVRVGDYPHWDAVWL